MPLLDHIQINTLRVASPPEIETKVETLLMFT